MFSSGMYFSAEAGYSDYDNIQVNDIGNSNNSAKGDAKADPSTAFGQFSIGYKF